MIGEGVLTHTALVGRARITFVSGAFARASARIWTSADRADLWRLARPAGGRAPQGRREFDEQPDRVADHCHQAWRVRAPRRDRDSRRTEAPRTAESTPALRRGHLRPRAVDSLPGFQRGTGKLVRPRRRSGSSSPRPPVRRSGRPCRIRCPHSAAPSGSLRSCNIRSCRHRRRERVRCTSRRSPAAGPNPRISMPRTGNHERSTGRARTTHTRRRPVR
jgi:hypothetical protein